MMWESGMSRAKTEWWILSESESSRYEANTVASLWKFVWRRKYEPEVCRSAEHNKQLLILSEAESSLYVWSKLWENLMPPDLEKRLYIFVRIWDLWSGETARLCGNLSESDSLRAVDLRQIVWTSCGKQLWMIIIWELQKTVEQIWTSGKTENSGNSRSGGRDWKDWEFWEF